MWKEALHRHEDVVEDHMNEVEYKNDPMHDEIDKNERKMNGEQV